MQRDERDVRAGVRVVDRVDLAVADQRLARVELPAEERVHRAADRHHLAPGLRLQERVVDLVAVVERAVGLEAHDHRLGADRQRAGEHVEPVDRALEVHQPLAGLVVAGLQLRPVAHLAHADPGAAVERLHEQRVADLAGDLGQVERLVVALGGIGEALVGRRLLVRDQPRAGDLHPKADHRAVGGVLLHRLERERVVRQVHVVHQRDLLDPLARHVVPVGEAVDDERVARAHAQVERLDRHALGGDRVLLAGVVDRSGGGARDERLERLRPVLLRAEQEADQVRAGHGRVPTPRRGRANRPAAGRACRASSSSCARRGGRGASRRAPGGAAPRPPRGCWRGSPRARRR